MTKHLKKTWQSFQYKVKCRLRSLHCNTPTVTVVDLVYFESWALRWNIWNMVDSSWMWPLSLKAPVQSVRTRRKTGRPLHTHTRPFLSNKCPAVHLGIARGAMTVDRQLSASVWEPVITNLQRALDFLFSILRFKFNRIGWSAIFFPNHALRDAQEELAVLYNLH